MSEGAGVRPRLLLAAVVAFGLDFALGFGAARILPANALLVQLRETSVVQPASCLILFFSLAVGGWIAGRRFVPVAMVLVFLLQVLAIGLLVQIAHAAVPAPPLPLVAWSVLHRYALGFGLQLLAALTGTLAGASLHRPPPDPPASQEPPCQRPS